MKRCVAATAVALLSLSGVAFAEPYAPRLMPAEKERLDAVVSCLTETLAAQVLTKSPEQASEPGQLFSADEAQEFNTKRAKLKKRLTLLQVVGDVSSTRGQRQKKASESAAQQPTLKLALKILDARQDRLMYGQIRTRNVRLDDADLAEAFARVNQKFDSEVSVLIEGRADNSDQSANYGGLFLERSDACFSALHPQEP